MIGYDGPRCTLILHFLLLASPWTAFAEIVDEPARPRIGLALQGGGAKGFAHIGVLEWLEQNRIPVDRIAGTSMGGLIGGFYATGRSVADLKELQDSRRRQSLAEFLEILLVQIDFLPVYFEQVLGQIFRPRSVKRLSTGTVILEERDHLIGDSPPIHTHIS